MLSYIELSKENLRHNVAALKKLCAPQTKIAAVIKGNAYGHYQNLIATLLEKNVDYFQVDDLEELQLLRKVSKKPTLVLGYVPLTELTKLVALKAIPGIYSIEQLNMLNKIGSEQNKKIAVHIKIDALLGRQGILSKEIPNFIKTLKNCTGIKVDGIYSHFSNIEDTSDFTHAQKQLDNFKKTVESFKKAGFKDFKTHISATSGLIVYDSRNPEFDIVRLGIGLYGLWPSEDLKTRFSHKLELKPVLRWVTHIAQIKILPKNFPIGYGLTYVTTKPTKVAVIPQGYSDGYDRGLSNIGEVLIRGKRCPVLGRVAMNMFVVNVSHVKNVNLEDEVVLLGKRGNEEITAEEIAQKLGTINYEVVTRISPLLSRVVV